MLVQPTQIAPILWVLSTALAVMDTLVMGQAVLVSYCYVDYTLFNRLIQNSVGL